MTASEQTPVAGAAHLKPRLIKRLAPILVIAVAAVAVFVFIYMYSEESPRLFTGYIVSDNVYLASPDSGILADAFVARGDRVEPGDGLFQLDLTTRKAQVERILSDVEAAKAQFLQAEARLYAARTSATRAQLDLDRLLTAQLQKTGSVAQMDVDHAREGLEQAQAELAAAQQISAAMAFQAQAAEAAQQEAQRRLDELTAYSPVSGRVEDVTYKQGEWVVANIPVVSIVPDDQIKIRFYVPQELVHEFPVLTPVWFRWSGQEEFQTAKVEFVSTRPEYTPPVIYSRETREKLVFMVEAIPEHPLSLIPGQPIDVRPKAP